MLGYAGGLGSVELYRFLVVKADLLRMRATDALYRQKSWGKKQFCRIIITSGVTVYNSFLSDDF